jgi:hypothetical protein
MGGLESVIRRLYPQSEMEVIDPLPLSWDHGVVRELLYLGVGGDRNVTKAASDWLSVCVDSSQ